MRLSAAGFAVAAIADASSTAAVLSALSLSLSLAFAPTACQPTRPEAAAQSSAAAPTALAVAAPAPSRNLAGRCVEPLSSAPPPSPPHGPDPNCPADPEGGGPMPASARVVFPEVGGVHVDAERVSDSHDTMRGLMYRRSMAEDHGMLFDLREREQHNFWMHNTCIPLDMLFIDEDGLLVGIVENAPTLNDQSRGVGCPSRYVLEVNAGWSRRHGVRPGQWVTLPR